MKLMRKPIFIILVLAVLCMITAGIAVAGKIDSGAGEIKDGNKLTQEQIEEYQQQGYTLTDIYTAQSISRKINVSISDLLKEKAVGLTWPEVITKRAPGVVLKREDDIGKEPPKIDKKKVQELLAQGFSLSDISEAFTIAWRYDKTIESVFENKKGKKEWRDVDSDFAKGRSENQGKEKGEKIHKISFIGENGNGKEDKSKDGLSADDVNKYLQKGYEVKDIVKADAIAKKLNISLDEVMARKTSSNGWGEVISQLVKENSETGENTKPNMVKDFEYPSEAEHSATKILDASKSGLTVDQINLLLEKYPAKDVFAADSLAAKYGFNVETALKLKESGKSWRDIIAATGAFDISMSTDDLVNRYNLDADYVNSLLHDQGLKLSDIMTAGEISLGTKKSFREVIELRLASSNWQEVFDKLGIKVQSLPPEQQGGGR